MNLPDIKPIKGGGDVMAWSAIGEVVGNLVGLAVPNTIIPDASLGHAFGVVFGALTGLGYFNKYKTSSGSDLDKKLSDIEKLFITDRITEQERNLLREKCLKDYQKKM